MGLSFHWRSGSSMRASKRRFCSLSLDLEPDLDQLDAAIHDVLLELGADLEETLVLLFEQKPITYSTPARLYQLRSKITISPAAGECWSSAACTSGSSRGRRARAAPPRGTRAG